MEKLFNLSKRQIIAVSWAAVAIGIAGMLAMGVAANSQFKQAGAHLDHIPTVEADTEIKPEPAQDRPSKPRPTQTTTQPTTPKATAQAQPKAAEPAKTEPGGHVPFTNKPVTPGEPESYIDTVGQCPFYEMVGPKGCYPPSNIICNDDWTVCKPVDSTLDYVGDTVKNIGL